VIHKKRMKNLCMNITFKNNKKYQKYFVIILKAPVCIKASLHHSIVLNNFYSKIKLKILIEKVFNSNYLYENILHIFVIHYSLKYFC